MPVSKELMMAILSMDSYSREYNAGIVLDSVAIGNVTVNDHEASGITPSDYQAWQDAGFYAVAYDWNGETVISYRGTNADSAYNLYTDAVNGYGLGAGYPYDDQAWLAAQFFQSVTGTTGGDPKTGSAILTGHSLGGGLAGFVASIYGQNAYIYDNMTFEGGAETLFGLTTSTIPGDMLE